MTDTINLTAESDRNIIGDDSTPSLKENLAYAAGFIDGEGSIIIWKHKNEYGNYQYQLRLTIGNTHEDGLLFMEKLFGGHIYKNFKGKGNRKIHHQWHIYGYKAFECIKQLYPYLKQKKPQADIAKSLFIKNSKIGGSIELYSSMKKLNQRGVNIL